MNRVLGAERVFGYGSAARGPHPFAELLTEAVLRDRQWSAGPARELDPSDPLAAAAPAREHPLGWWLRQESFRDRMRREVNY